MAGGRNVRTREVAGTLSLVEGRGLNDGNGVVLVDDRATGLWRAVGRNLGLPLLAGLLAGCSPAPCSAAGWPARSATRPSPPPARPATPGPAAGRAAAGGGRPRRRHQRAGRALATSEGRQREFLLSVSHELRTPLTTIRGYAEALADGVVPAAGVPQGRANHSHRSRTARPAGRRPAFVARLEAADFAIDPIPIDLARLVAGPPRPWRPRCDAAGIQLRVEGGPAPTRRVRRSGRLPPDDRRPDGHALRVVPSGTPVVLAVGSQSGAARSRGARRRAGPDRRRPGGGFRTRRA